MVAMEVSVSSLNLNSLNLNRVKLSVIVCTYNREDLVKYALSSLVAQSLDNTLYEVLVVDNNSQDSTISIVRQFEEKYENFHLIIEREQGLSFARNRGWREAKGIFVAYMDDDAKAFTDWCEKIVQAFECVSPTPIAVGGDIDPWYEKEPPKWFSDDMEIRTWHQTKGFLEPQKAKYGFWGSNMAFQRAVLEEYGGFSCDYGMLGEKARMGEDTEFFGRISQFNKPLWYDPSICVSHWVPECKLQIAYRFLRKIRIGQAESSLRSDVPIFMTLLSALKCTFKIGFLLLWPSSQRMNRAVKTMERLAFDLGLLGRVVF